MLIDVRGVPGEIVVERSSGFPALDEAAIAALRRSRFRPYVDAGRPRAATAVVPFTFRLE